MTNYKTDIVLGNTYRDRVSGWEGVATSLYFYMNKCVRVEINATDENDQPKGFIFDEEQLEHVDDVSTIVTESTPSGGSRSSTPVVRS